MLGEAITYISCNETQLFLLKFLLHPTKEERKRPLPITTERDELSCVCI